MFQSIGDTLGLKDGKIPAGFSCPFREKCSLINSDCPSEDAPKSQDYSCFAARAWAMISCGSDNATLRKLISIRKIVPIKENKSTTSP
jgi:hypothetical protein